MTDKQRVKEVYPEAEMMRVQQPMDGQRSRVCIPLSGWHEGDIWGQMDGESAAWADAASRLPKATTETSLCDVCKQPLEFPADDDPAFVDDTAVTSKCRHTVRVRDAEPAPEAAKINWQAVYSGEKARDANMEVARLTCKRCGGLQENCTCPSMEERKPAPQTFEEWMLPAAQEINRTQLSRDHIIKNSFGLKHPIMSVDEQVAIMRKHWNAAKASSSESENEYVKAFNDGVEVAVVAFEYMWQDWIGAAAYMRKQKKPLIKDVRGKE